jgi:hypothetical protein
MDQEAAANTPIPPSIVEILKDAPPGAVEVLFERVKAQFQTTGGELLERSRRAWNSNQMWGKGGKARYREP